MKKAFLFGIGILLTGSIFAAATNHADQSIGSVPIDVKSSGGSVSAEEFNLMTQVTNLFLGTLYSNEGNTDDIMMFPKSVGATQVLANEVCIAGICKEEWPTSTSGVTLPDVNCPEGKQLQSVHPDGTFTCGTDLTAAGSGVTDFNCDPGEFVEGYKTTGGVGKWACSPDQTGGSGGGINEQTCLEGAGYVVNGIDASGVFTCVQDATGTGGTGITNHSCEDGELVKGIVDGTFVCVADQTTSGGSADNLGNHTATTALITKDIKPDGHLTRNIGTPTLWYSNLYVEDINMGGNTLTMDGDDIMKNNNSSLEFTAPMNDAMRVKTTGTGIMNVNSSANLNMEIISGTNKLLKIKNNSTGGDIEIATLAGATASSSKITMKSNNILLGELPFSKTGINLIANTSPAYTLDVNGDINFTGDLYKNGVIYGGGIGDDPTCTPVLRSSHKCETGDLWWYDSCGTKGTKKQECGSPACTTGEVNLPCNGNTIALSVPGAPTNVSVQYPNGGYCLRNGASGSLAACSLMKLGWEAPSNTGGLPITKYVLELEAMNNLLLGPPINTQLNETQTTQLKVSASSPFVFNSNIFNPIKNIFYETAEATASWTTSIPDSAAISIENLIENLDDGTIASDAKFLKDIGGHLFREVPGTQTQYIIRHGDIPEGTWKVRVYAYNPIGSSSPSSYTSNMGIIEPVPSPIAVGLAEIIESYIEVSENETTNLDF